MIGSALGAPSETTIAEAITARLTYASARAWCPSAISAALCSRRPLAEADARGEEVAGVADRPGEREHRQMGRSRRV